MSLTLAPGRVIAGTYRLASQIRRGRFGGPAWRGWRVDSQQRVTVVFLAPSPDAAGLVARRFLTVSAVQHPNLATALDHGVDGDLPFVVFEGLEGETVAASIPRRRFTATESLRLADQLLEALALAHERGVVHGALEADAVFLIQRAHGVLSPKLLGLGMLDPAGAPADDVRAVAALLAELTALPASATGSADAGPPPELAPLLARATAGDPALATALAMREALEDVARQQRRPRTGRDARLVLATAPSMQRAMNEVLDFQTSEHTAVPLDLTGAPLNPDGTPVTGRRPRPAADPLVPGLAAVRIEFGDAPGLAPPDPNSGRFARPVPDSGRFARPVPSSGCFARPDPDSSDASRVEVESAGQLRPTPDSGRHLRPALDFPERSTLGPSTAPGAPVRTVQPFGAGPPTERPVPPSVRLGRPGAPSARTGRPRTDHPEAGWGDAGADASPMSSAEARALALSGTGEAPGLATDARPRAALSRAGSRPVAPLLDAPTAARPEPPRAVQAEARVSPAPPPDPTDSTTHSIRIQEPLIRRRSVEASNNFNVFSRRRAEPPSPAPGTGAFRNRRTASWPGRRWGHDGTATGTAVHNPLIISKRPDGVLARTTQKGRCRSA